MADAPEPLILDFLEWLEAAPRPYGEVMEAWRTSCPRLTVWEDSLEQGFVAYRRRKGAPALVELTTLGDAFIRSSRGAA